MFSRKERDGKGDAVPVLTDISQSQRGMENATCSNMDGPRDGHTEQSEPEKAMPQDTATCAIYLKQKQRYRSQPVVTRRARERDKLGDWN